MFAAEYWKEGGCEPDILTTAKSIAGGLPLSAVTARKEIFDATPVGTIGGTYGGNALSCASALKLIETMEKKNLPRRALEIADKLNKAYNNWKDMYDVVGDVRGIGCMMGIEFVTDKKTKKPNAALVNAIIDDSVQSGLLLENAGTYGNVIRFLAPLVITDAQIEAGLKIFEDSIRKNII